MEGNGSLRVAAISTSSGVKNIDRREYFTF